MSLSSFDNKCKTIVYLFSAGFHCHRRRNNGSVIHADEGSGERSGQNG